MPWYIPRERVILSVTNSSCLHFSRAGIYFSAHWCPPCRGFTPVLANCYNKLKDAGKKFEVVFVSSDQDQEAFEEYYGEMPWLTIGFDPDKEQSLSTKYGVQGIPTLVIVDKKGNEKTRDARKTVAKDEEGKNFPWDLL